ncbi:hypothetical protein E1263_05025 [Kribbella antibiotica]|uniref:Recombinase family protein n=1 Tax=Kribbella antibiotica TaxID=190195 RepID=A0A4R4ZUW8_9ACTN|nr:hypothetical protein [Kribbella antibiotica]TDD61984.1 hypothetical protein E1263_05025 [Kribbella antibiotica]
MKVAAYARWFDHLSESDITELQSRMFRAAHSRGLTVHYMFIDEPKGQRSFEAALFELARTAQRYFIVPSLDHLADIDWGSPLKVVEELTFRRIEVIITP